MNKVQDILVILGITVHFVYEKYLCNYFLGLIEMKGEHTATSVKAHMEELLAEFNLSTEKCFRIVTDGGSNFVAAFKNLKDLCNNIINIFLKQFMYIRFGARFG